MEVLKIKSQGGEVRILQELLLLNNYEISVDGIFGKGTEGIVREFQKNNPPLSVDGIVGDATWKVLMDHNHISQVSNIKLKPDSYTLNKIKTVHPKLRDELSQIYNEIQDRKVSIRITDTLRTFKEQQVIYNQGRTTPGKIVTNAKPGQSYHNYGLAIDFALLLPGGKKVSWDMNLDLNNNHQKDWNEVVAVFKHYGWEWGGNWTSFKDYPHFEKTFGYSTKALLDLYEKGELENNYVKF